LIDHPSCQLKISGERIKASNGQPVFLKFKFNYYFLKKDYNRKTFGFG